MKAYKSIALLSVLFLLSTTISLATDYFWIGGSGNWEDITHWATTSGGVVTHDQTPSADDDVYFDANSFTAPNQTVTINNNVAFSRSLDFTNALFTPSFVAGDNVILSVFGGFLLTDGMTFDFDGTLFFASDQTTNTIDLSVHNAGSNVTFDGSGAWEVVSDLVVTEEINISSGDITFTNNQVNCQFLYSRSNAVRNIAFDNSQLTISGITIDPQEDGRESNIYTIRLSTDNLTWTSTNNATVNITSSYAKMLLEGSGTVDFGTLSTVNDEGDFSLISLDDLTTLSVSQNLNLTKNADINAELSIGTLSLYPSYRYVFEATKTIAMESLDAAGTCQASIIVASSISGLATTWTPSQPIVGDYLTLIDIHTSGNTATANNSIDLGNNVGWTINEKIAEDFFWVGGTGNWDEGNHWALTSGGAPSGCVPTAVDDVYFDNNSFNAAGQEVTINIANAACHSMDWQGVTNNPSLIGPVTNNVLIYGSLSFDTNMAHTFEGDYYFSANDLNNTITSSGQIFNRDVYFDNADGGWNLVDEFTVTAELRLVNGALNTQSQNVNCFRFDSDYETNRSLTLGASLITLTPLEYQYFYFWLESENLTFDAGTSIILFNGGSAECVTRGNQALTYHNIVFTNLYSTLNSVSQSQIKHTFNKVTYLQEGNISGNNNIDTLVLSNGFSYGINSGTDQDIDVLLWDDICDGLIGLFSYTTGATIRLGTTQTLEGFNISKINFDNNPSIVAEQSVDGSSNSGIDFQDATGRDLYWVGGSGDWADITHWSLSSGGPGGECVPTIIDNVFFDDNSFTTDNDIINLQTGNTGYCRNFTFTAQNQNGRFQVPIIETSGNIDVQERWSLVTLHIVGGFGPQTIRTSGSEIRGMEVRGSADVIQLDDLYNSGGIYFFDAVFYSTNNFVLDVSIMSTSNRNDDSPTLDFGASLIRIQGEKRGFFYPFTFSGGTTSTNNMANATYEFTNSQTGVNASANVDLGNLIFTAADGEAIVTNFTNVISYRSLIFRGDAIVDGAVGVTIDTLVLSGGKSYTFESGLPYVITSHIQARGNNCIPISWQSSQNGVDVQLTIPADNFSVDMDFVEMNGISIVCCAEYFAGNNSTNIGNSNEGWIFGDPDNTPVDEGFFGPDIIICDDNSLTLMPFLDGEVNSITWNDGSTDLDFTVLGNSTVSALVLFTNNCAIRDTVNVSFETSFSIDLGADTTLCEGASFLLNPNIAGAEYEWQDMSSNATYLVDGAGTYSVFADLGTCEASDTIVVNYQTAPELTLPELALSCEGDSILLNADIGNSATYLWEDGSTNPSLEVKTDDTYIVTITDNACILQDTIQVAFAPNPIIETLVDSTICEGEEIAVGPTDQTGLSYLWSSGSTDAVNMISSNGYHAITVTDMNNCSSSDSLFLTVNPIPLFTLGSDTTMCEGDMIEIGTEINYDNFEWSEGGMQSTTFVDGGGDYWLTAIQDNCSFTDTIFVNEVLKPIVDFGLDRSICTGDSIILDATNSNATYNWNTGSTDPMIIVKIDGTYTVEVEFDGCSNADTINLITEPTPFFELGPDQMLCEGANAVFNIPADTDWMISWSNGSTSNEITVTQSDEYIAESILGGCSHSDTVNVFFNPLPIVNLGIDAAICDGDSLILDVSNTGAVYNWNTGSMESSIVAKEEGNYISMVSLNGCVNSDTIMLSVDSTPFFDLGSDESLCEGDSLELMIASDPSWVIDWNTGSNQSTITVKESNNYVAEVTLGNCSYEDEVMVVFNPNPTVDLGDDKEKCEQVSLTLNVETPNVEVLWENGSTNATRIIESAGTYSVEVETPEGCIANDEIVITDITCAKFEVYFPTAFTPNQDGTNDTYVVGFSNNVDVSAYLFSIYDRWGNLMFKTNDPTANWDGTFKSKMLNAGVFVAVLDITYSDDFIMNETTTLTSDFVLMR